MPDLWDNGVGPAAEQLYDELMARAWAMQSVAPTTSADPTTAETRDALAGAARRLVHRIEANPAEGVAELGRVSWPCGPAVASDDPWWRTRLGLLLNSQHTAPAGACG